MNIWDQEDDYGILAPLSEQDIQQIEHELQITFPESFLSVLRKQNGGCLLYNAVSVDFENTWSEPGEASYLPIRYLEGLSYDSFTESTKLVLPEWGITGKHVTIGDGEGTYIYYLNFDQQDNNPSVWYLDTSDESTREVAPTFQDFLSRWMIQEPDLEPLDLEAFYASYPSMEEINLSIQSEDIDTVLYAFGSWMTIGLEQERLVHEMMKRINTTTDPDLLDFFAQSLTNLVLNTGADVYVSNEQLARLLESKGVDSDLNVYINWLRAED